MASFKIVVLSITKTTLCIERFMKVYCIINKFILLKAIL